MFFRSDAFEPGPGVSSNAPERTGAARFFELLQRECVDLFKLNLLFALCCLPVLTIPPAVYAMNHVVRRMTQDLSGRCVHHYWTAFRRHWKRAWGAFLAVALPLTCAGYGALFYLRGAAESPLLFLPFLVCSTVFLAALLASPYLYGLLSLDRPLGSALRSALVLGLARPLRGALAALCTYGSILAAVLAFPLSLSYLLLIGFSLPCLLANFFLRTVLAKVQDPAP